MNLKKRFWIIRRQILKYIIPESVWPKTVSIDNVEIKIRHTPYSFGTKKALIQGDYEIEEISLLAKHIQHDDQIIEMGGSIGILTAVMGSYISKKGRIISIEASKKITEYSATWLEEKSNVKVLVGFGFPVFEIKNRLKINDFDESGGTLSGRVSYNINENTLETSNNKNNIYDFKKIINEFNMDPTVLVIDIEGSEEVILKCNMSCPPTVRIILIEFHPNIYGQEKSNEIVNNIIQEGFKINKIINEVYLFERK